MSQRIVFMGTPDFAVTILQALIEAKLDVAAVVTVPDRQSGRGLKVTPSPVKIYAQEQGLPILQPEKLRDEIFLGQLRAINADLFIVVAFRMLPQVVWAMPRLGTFNLHASLLPQYRGAAPINWAIINGEKETGVTTFMLNERIDEGSIIMQRSIAIGEEDNAETVHDRLAEIGAELTVETARAILAGSAKTQPQRESAELKPAPKIFKQDCVIDWSKNGKEIHNFIRGLSPYPAATTTFTNGKGESIGMKIFDTRFEGKEHKKPVGSIESDNKKSLKILVKGGFIEILSLQVNGKRKITIDEFLRGYNITDWRLGI